jgi:serine protease
MLHSKSPCLALLLLFALYFIFFPAPAQSSAADLTPMRELPDELIVLLDDLPSSPTPEAVVESAAERRPLPGGLGIGSPSAARFVIPAADRDGGDTSEEGRRLLRYVVLSYSGAGELESIKAALTKNPHVLWVDYNWPLHLSATTNDPLFAVTGSPATHQWGLHSLKIPEAWDYNKGRAYVAVVDTGIDTTHPDLKTYNFDGSGNLLSLGPYRRRFAADYGYPGDNCSATPGLDCNGQPSKGCVDEGQPQVEGSCRTVVRAGHGTHVAGIVAATTNNSAGISGVCWNCSLMVSKVSRLANLGGIGWSNVGTSQADVVAGITGSVRQGAQAMNLSLGFRPPPDCNATPNHVLCTTVAFATKRDVVIAAASGNDFSSIVDYPASDPRAIGVGGISSTGAFWNDCPVGQECGSNYSPDQLVAPAKQVLSTFYRGLFYSGAGTVCPGFDPYGLCTGTSMAAPHIAGAAGLLRSVNPLVSADNVKYLLRSNLDNPPGWSTQNGYGKPHVANAVKAALGKSGAVQLPNRLTPLFSLYSDFSEDHFYTTVPQMATSAIFDWGFYAPIGPTIPSYGEFPGTVCQVGPCPYVTPTASVHIFTGDRAPFAGALPLVPLYRMTYVGANPNGNNNHRDSTYTTELPGVKAFNAVGYELDGIEGYIYQKCTPEPSCMPTGTVRLLRRYHPQRDDFAIFPESQLATMEGQGYVSLGGGSGVLGYVYPNTDGDGDTLVDGFERLAGTDPARADSDCDSVNDGQELLNFGSTGYGDPLAGPGCAFAAQFVSQSVPTTMKARRVYSLTATFKNIGTQTWSPVGAPQCGDFRVGSPTVAWAGHRGQLPAPVPPGATATTSFFELYAPETAGIYPLPLQMVQECVQWFGALGPPTHVNVLPAPVKDAQYRWQTVPTTMRAGQTYLVSFRMRNVGTTTWSPVGPPACGVYRLGLWSADNLLWGVKRGELSVPVAPGEAQTIAFNVTAPLTPGTYPFQWKMVHECVEWFGDTSEAIIINVIP